MNINELLSIAKSKQASDLIVKVNAAPLIRVNGNLTALDFPKLTQEKTVELAKNITSEKEWAEFEKELELDMAYSVSGISRFRVNIFKQRSSVGLVFRLISDIIPSVDDIDLPETAKSLVTRPRGMVLVTGPAGSGKSTTQAALIDKLNREETAHIMTIEDPIEFVHTDKKGIINQRQIGRDTLSFASGLKYVLRQDPDLILIGEMRDLETISLAVTIAETGHLLLGTLHTTDAAQTVDRVIHAFPIHQQQQIRMQLSVNLIGVISQLLLQKADGSGVAVAFEVMVVTTAIRNCIREGKTHQIPQVMQTGGEHGMVSMERSLSKLVNSGVITIDEALAKAPRPEALEDILPITRESGSLVY